MSNNTKYCPKCGVVMYVDTNKHRTDPSCYEVFCPQCGETEIVKAEIITMTDLGNHIECPFCNKKDQRIAELEKELEKTKCLYNDSIDREIFLTDEERRTYYKNVELKKENAELKQKLADLKGETK